MLKPAWRKRLAVVVAPTAHKHSCGLLLQTVQLVQWIWRSSSTCTCNLVLSCSGSKLLMCWLVQGRKTPCQGDNHENDSQYRSPPNCKLAKFSSSSLFDSRSTGLAAPRQKCGSPQKGNDDLRAGLSATGSDMISPSKLPVLLTHRLFGGKGKFWTRPPLYRQEYWASQIFFLLYNLAAGQLMLAEQWRLYH